MEIVFSYSIEILLYDKYFDICRLARYNIDTSNICFSPAQLISAYRIESKKPKTKLYQLVFF